MIAIHLFLYVGYFTVLLCCTYVAFGLWRQSRDKATFWYIWYVLTTVCHHLPDFGKRLTLAGQYNFIPDLPLRWDAPMSYLATSCYLMFTFIVLDMREKMPLMGPVMIRMAQAHIGLFVVNVVLQLFFPYEVWKVLHQAVRLLLFPVMIWMVIYMFPRAPYFYQKLILIGTSVLLFSFISAFAKYPFEEREWEYINVVPDFFYSFRTPFGNIWLFDTKIGVAIDVVIFLWAINLRQKRLLHEHSVRSIPIPEVRTVVETKVIMPLSTNATNVWLAQLNEFLETNHHHKHLKVTDIAKAMFVSQEKLNRKLKEKANLTTEQYLLRYRLEKALVLLRDTDETISTIASLVGMDDPAHFSRAFKKQYYCNPTEIRKKGVQKGE
jgi:AraC-like DNA-binding protein